MKIKTIKGCLISAFKNGDVGAIGHCANCFNSMGPVIARVIAQEFPEAYHADQQTIKGDGKKLGSLSLGKTSHGLVFNLYGQYNYFSPGVRQYVSYPALGTALANMKKICLEQEDIPVVGFPYKIGCGRAGGDWNIVEGMIDKIFSDYPKDVFIYNIEKN